MLYALSSAPMFIALCFFIGAPLSRRLLGAPRFATHLASSAVIGFAVMAVAIEPLFRLVGSMGPVVWIFLAAAAAGIITEGRVAYAKRREAMANVAPALAIAAGAAALLAALAALPIVADEAYGLYRTNSSDAAVNITVADLWRNVRSSTLDAYLEQPSQPATDALVAESPIGIFSARFTEYGVRIATGMIMGLWASLFALPTYAVYLPFMLACAAMGGFAGYALLRQVQAPRWFAALTAFSVLGGWSYIIRESDNSNQFGAFPLMIGALLLVASRFERGEGQGWALRSGAALGLVLAGVVTIYPELGLMFGAAVGGALVISSRRREDWLAGAATGLAGALLLAVNGQALALYNWIGVLQSDALGLGRFVGPTGALIQRDGWVAALGLYVPWLPPILAPFIGGVAIAGLGLAAIRGAVSSRVGLAFALFALICCVIAWRGFADGTPFIAYRAASFFGMASLIGAAAAVWSIPRNAGPRMRHVYRITGFVGAACLCVMAVAGAGFWTQSFVRPHTDYSTLADINEKAYLRALPGLRAAIDRAPLGSIGVYLPPVDFAALPWPQLLYVHMMAAQRDAVFLSGFMNNNNDTRTPTGDGVYDPERTVEYVLVTVVRDPVPAVFGGERVGHGRGFRLYRIAPTPWRTVRDQLASADSEGRGE